MGKPHLLIVEDDYDIAQMLRIYFTSQHFAIDIAHTGMQALEKTRRNLPQLIVLDIMLPDIDGFEVCRLLRTNTRTSHVPIIFLTHKNERRDRLQGLELGADDYIAKPFDIEELKLRAQRAITRAEQQSLTDPRSGLPSGRLIEEQLRRIMHQPDWVFMDIRIQHYEPFKEVYGFLAGDEVLRFTALLLGEIVEEQGMPDDFIGHAGEAQFVLITGETAAPPMRQKLTARFKEEVLPHYSFIDREQGYLLAGQEQHPLMTLAIGAISSAQYEFADIRQITELAAEARRKQAG